MSALSRLRASWSHGRDRWLLGAATAMLLACLLDPGLTLERSLFEHVIVLDITQSMNVADQQLEGKAVSRLAFAKHALRQSLLELPCGSKVGWAIFTEYRSYLLLAPVEVCASLDELRATLARIEPGMAWSGNSEIAKGLHSGIGIAKQLPERPTLVFITDGHEAPPLNPHYRPAFDDKPGDVQGLIVGVGEPLPSSIPKTDPLGRPLGVWRADEVMQTDPRSQGRGVGAGAGAGAEAMVDDRAGDPMPSLGATPGTEHLSSLREPYLRLLAGEQGLGFHRLQSAQGLATALMAPALGKPLRVRVDARDAFAGLALCLLLARYARPIPLRLRRARARGS